MAHSFINIFPKLLLIGCLCLVSFSCKKDEDKDVVVPDELSIYPNPASVKVVVATKGKGAINLYNKWGQLLITKPATETDTLNVSSLMNGVYIVQYNNLSKSLVVAN